jgi:hypothetical protein
MTVPTPPHSCQATTEKRNITHIRDTTGTLFTTNSYITDCFLAHIQNKYQAIAGEEAAIQSMLQAIHPPHEDTLATTPAQPIQEQKVRTALRMGAKRKAPGVDGLTAELYSNNWNTISKDITSILNRHCQDNLITPQVTHEIIVCLPKVSIPSTIKDYRPITLLNTKYKLYARVLALRIKDRVGHYLQDTQYSGATGANILDALAAVRETIANAEHKRTPT